MALGKRRYSRFDSECKRIIASSIWFPSRIRDAFPYAYISVCASIFKGVESAFGLRSGGVWGQVPRRRTRASSPNPLFTIQGPNRGEHSSRAEWFGSNPHYRQCISDDSLHHQLPMDMILSKEKCRIATRAIWRSVPVLPRREVPRGGRQPVSLRDSRSGRTRHLPRPTYATPVRLIVF
jgi:hypothetical protein